MIYTIFNWFVKITGYIPQKLIFRMKVHYEDKAVQGRHIRSKAIVVSNHNHLFDFAVLLFAFPTRTLRCAVAEITYDKNIFMKLFLKLVGCIRVERESYDFSFLEKMKKILKCGGVVEIYPEARLPRKGEPTPLEFKPSFVYLALESGAPIIPVYSNAQIFGKNRERIVIGKPIDAAALYDSTLCEKENIKNITLYVRSKIIELGKKLEEECKEK
ncbi:MAG: 1-acyl-sn-glycerol-3-phosphate acyltransferase [Ruminococcaceae bacterium]|nr:1-acyl-sn-glycerol-3-phosphate acyltransferase [Oscillospiraceae bacterium]